jgi:polysaccharide pyruvyl transferase WcaK-like protein
LSNAEADLVVVGGPNLLAPRKHRSLPVSAIKHSDWEIFADVVSIHRLQPPLLLVGMNSGSRFGKSIGRYTPEAREEVTLLHSHAFASGVRDQATAKRLSQIGVQAECIGSPVACLTDQPVNAGPANAPLVIAFPPARLARNTVGRMFLRQTVRYIEWLRQSGVDLVVSLHESDDLDLARDCLTAGIEMFYSTSIDEVIARYEASRGVIGFRLHSALAAMGLGKPAIFVGLDTRSTAVIDTLGIEQDSISAWRFGQFIKLRHLTDLVLQGDEGLIGRLAFAKARVQARYDSFLRETACRWQSLLTERLPKRAA